MEKKQKILFYGYGNIGRQDDGVGVVFSEQLSKWVEDNNLQNIDFDSNYQLNIEDAENIKNYDIVFFVDASTKESVNNFDISSIEPNSDVSFTMHAVSPGFILNICSEIGEHQPKSFLVQIKGYEWEFQQPLTAKTENNLQKTLIFFKKYLKKLLIEKKIEEIDLKSLLKIKND